MASCEPEVQPNQTVIYVLEPSSPDHFLFRLPYQLNLD